MSGTEVFLFVVLALTWAFTFFVQWLSYRDGWDHGYGAGYDDRDDEAIYDEPRGTRRGRTAR